MTSDRKRASEPVATDRTGLCRATTKQGLCRKKAVRDGLCSVHSGDLDMRELGRKGGRARPKAKREPADGERQTLREFLREQVDPAVVWKAIQAGLDSTNEKDKLAAAKMLLAELYEPAVERERENEAEAARARAEFEVMVDAISARRILQTLTEAGVIRPDPRRPFEGVVMFELRELAEWAGRWTPRPLEVSDVPCSTCGKPGVRVVAEGETADGGPVYCGPCEKAKAEAEATASSPAPAADPPPVPPVEESVEAATWPRRSLT